MIINYVQFKRTKVSMIENKCELDKMKIPFIAFDLKL